MEANERRWRTDWRWRVKEDIFLLTLRRKLFCLLFKWIVQMRSNGDAHSAVYYHH